MDVELPSDISGPRPIVLIEVGEQGLGTAKPSDGGTEVETRTETELPAITEHIEPADQGGEKYVRCEGCGHEILSKYGGRSKLSHADTCAHGRNDAEECRR